MNEQLKKMLLEGAIEDIKKGNTYYISSAVEKLNKILRAEKKIQNIKDEEKAEIERLERVKNGTTLRK